tara:strand:+ start:60 stop:494 length:435 start_codon:yes stop_codon:yes gene_type:complete
MYTEILSEIGLTKSEIDVYISLLDMGISTTGPIIKRAGIASGKAYLILDKLAKKGLVTYSIETGKKNYKATDPSILKNRNGYPGCDARIMPTNMKTPAWFMVYKNTSLIVLQNEKPVAVEIVNQEIADSFKAYFDDLWKRSKIF